MDPLGRRNRRVVETAQLHDPEERRLTGRTLIEGPHLLTEAIAAGVRPEAVFVLPGDEESTAVAVRLDLDLFPVDQEALSRIAGTRTPRGPVAVISIPMVPVGAAPGLLVAWGVSDPGNVGTMIRTAAAFGWDFGYTPGSADPWSPKALRAGSGGQFRARIVAVGQLSEIESIGYITVAMVVAGGRPPRELSGAERYALLVGEEAAGLPSEVVKEAAQRVTVPMPGGTESLNAAAAAAIVVYELSKPEGEHRVQV